MKKLLLLLLIFLAFKTFAQDTPKPSTAFSAGVEFGIPSRSLYNVGVGASLKLEQPVVSPVSLTLTAGFSSFFRKDSPFNNGHSGGDVFVPLKAGVRYNVGSGVFLEAEAGSAIELNYDERKLFAFSLGPAIMIPTGTDNRNFELGLRYESWSAHTLQQTAIRFAYRFGR
ncbi:hypothetical protein [Mucilaginibacter sp. NFR10]|uniref:hypothetical protein n=1 Tax=Mucilaginibacter sp. NFR10 TaxID=1566292 RepID=UPI0008716593|nr:hypothetical protein [Mucilaginibacter sp. NFR10]SCW68190.1 hypothetical protein SAMN03159284_02946 [Mucilaginibacter sp. NFR10]